MGQEENSIERSTLRQRQPASPAAPPPPLPLAHSPINERRRRVLLGLALAAAAAVWGPLGAQPANAAAPAGGGNAAVLDALKRRQKEQRMFGGDEPRAALAARFEVQKMTVAELTGVDAAERMV